MTGTTGGENALPVIEHTITLEIKAIGDPAALRFEVETTADRLMERLLGTPGVVDPSIMLAVHPDDEWSDDDPEMVFRPAHFTTRDRS